jgi:CheY-like chemotaxis protein
MPIVILSAGRDPYLSKKRDLALAGAGYKVVSATNSPEIINKLFNGDFDAVILCNSIPNDERKRLARIIKSYSPSTPIIVLAEMEGRQYDYGTMTASGSPDGIMAALRQAFAPPRASVA